MSTFLKSFKADYSRGKIEKVREFGTIQTIAVSTEVMIGLNVARNTTEHQTYIVLTTEDARFLALQIMEAARRADGRKAV